MQKKRTNGLLGLRIAVLRFLACALGSALLAASDAGAEPYLAIQEGYKCSKCHVNMTGGGKRTDFANVYVQTRLANQFFDWRRYLQPKGDAEGEPGADKTDAHSSFFSGRINDFIAIGGDFRALYEKNESPATEAFNQRKQNIYLEVDLIPDRVVFYQTLAEGGDAREILGLVKWSLFDEPGYFKVGQFFLPFGLRLQDDTAPTRAVTGFTYGSTDVGVEIGYEPGSWTMQAAVSNGTGSSLETNRSKRITASLAYVGPMLRLGGSYSANHCAQGVRTTIASVHAGVQVGRVGLLAEAAQLDDSEASCDVRQIVSIVELNFLMFRGNNLKFTYEYHDPSRAIFNNARTRYSLVYEPFVNQFTQVRIGYRDRRGIPQNPALNSNSYFAELHLFF